jgi:hypothetical protein
MGNIVKSLRCLLLLVVALVASGAANAVELAARTSRSDGVVVKVTPKNLVAGAAAWEFAVELDTHSGNLSDDLVKNSVLLDARGSEHAPLAWEGAGPGGHHRAGTLRFKGLATLPDAIELQIRRPGEPAPRSFRWTLK